MSGVYHLEPRTARVYDRVEIFLLDKMKQCISLQSDKMPMYKHWKICPCTIIEQVSAATALQSSNNNKINLYSKYLENKLQAFTK